MPILLWRRGSIGLEKRIIPPIKLPIDNVNNKIVVIKLGGKFKEDYRIIPVDVPIPLVNEHWVAYADVIIEKLVWENRQTTVLFRIDRDNLGL